VDDRRVTELETAIADAGALLVRLEKYRAGQTPAGEALRREALALGDDARRLHRRGALDDPQVTRLLAETQALGTRLGAAVRAVHESDLYRRAAAAHAAGDQATLARTVPELFAGVEPVPAPPDLHVAVPWRRRNRPLPPTALGAEIARLGAEGVEAEGDDLTPGTDPALAAVTLKAEPPADEPVVLRFARIELPVYLLSEPGDFLVYTPRLRAPFVVLLAPDAGDEQPRVEIDFARWRAELRAALGARGVPVGDP
jgi:hypothetical protein